MHVTTVNDYLAKRDAEWIGPVYKKLGMTVGILQQKMDENVRVEAYKADVTYGTASEFGFDFLRDRLKVRGGQAATSPFWAAWTGGSGRMDPRVQRTLHYAIVDEADSIFIDEAKTPLIIANPTRPAEPEEQVVFRWADSLARQMKRDEHFLMNAKKDKIELTDAGKQLIRYSNPPTGKHAKAMDKMHEAVERALHAHYRFQRDHHYMVNSEQKIVIIDEGTGRPMPDRHWRDGLHQAVEAKEGVQINMPSDHAAQITFQNFYRIYKKLAGMSGTLLPNFWELRKVYRRWTTKVPTNKPSLRETMPDLVFPTEEAKFDAVVTTTQKMLQAGRPVLIGTRTVEASKKVSSRLTALAITHQVLNAEQNANEAEVVAEAGQPGRVTVATNMAGRGTDIKLGPGVAANGGLHVIGTERHEAERIDRQLVGRAGRQGDPGSAQFMLSLEDQLLEGLGVAKMRELNELGKAGGDRDWNSFAPLFRVAQSRVEARHYRQRLDLKNYDKQAPGNAARPRRRPVCGLSECLESSRHTPCAYAIREVSRRHTACAYYYLSFSREAVFGFHPLADTRGWVGAVAGRHDAAVSVQFHLPRERFAERGLLRRIDQHEIPCRPPCRIVPANQKQVIPTFATDAVGVIVFGCVRGWCGSARVRFWRGAPCRIAALAFATHAVGKTSRRSFSGRGGVAHGSLPLSSYRFSILR